MCCTDPEFAETLRASAAPLGGETPFTARELDERTSRERALSDLAHAIANETYAARRGWGDLRDELAQAVDEARSGAKASGAARPLGVWIGRAYLTKWMAVRAAVCLDCGWVGSFRPRNGAAADLGTHSC